MKKRIFVAGHNGMVGSSLVKILRKNSDNIIFTADRQELDLTKQNAVNHYFSKNKFDQVYLAAAKVGGIKANFENPADFAYQNLIIQANVIHAAHFNNIQQLLFLGSSCIYPKNADQPIKEESILSGPLEVTNASYAIAKIAGIKLCESYNRQHGRDFRSVMPCNLYGKNDNFNYSSSHVIPSLIRRIHEAKISNQQSIVVWGTGTPKREFLYVDEMAEACVYLLNLKKNNYEKQLTPEISHINIGSGEEFTIHELVELIIKIIGYQGNFVYDKSKPDGTPQKLLDVSRLKRLGWSAKKNLREGLSITYEWFLKNQDKFRK